MLKAHIKPGTEYGFRERLKPGTPFQRVRAIEHIRKNKWKVEWIDPNPGLIDYVESGQLIVPWKNHKALLKEEQSAKELREYIQRHGYDNDDFPVPSAIQQVLESMGDDVSFYRGCMAGYGLSLTIMRTQI